MNADIKIIDVFGVAFRGFNKEYTASCPGVSHVTRIDTEAPEIPGFAPLGVSGFQVHCSDGSPVQGMNSQVGIQLPIGLVKQFAGSVVSAGIKDVTVLSSGLLQQFAYAGIIAPTPVSRTNPPTMSWRQSESAFSACLLKGLKIWSNVFVHSLARPDPGSLAATNVAPSQIPFTTTITVGSGASATTIITVITPGVAPAPLTVTLPGGTPIVITQVSGGGAVATFAPVPGTPLALPSSSSSVDDIAFLSWLIIALCLVVAALASVLMYLRMRRRKHRRQRHGDIELVDVNHSMVNREIDTQQVDPPAYLVAPIPEAGPVDDVPNELAVSDWYCGACPWKNCSSRGCHNIEMLRL
ncbi:hypothetical protein BCR44DRAFT_1457516 [Catenaria anguillulae PL171]|uniref:Uncharacterized protein n=1 Tax=Catenaria anguillulae PL171 TaxID=765915 RepID=A0A1Y2I2H3_9FUNG|nr:hypothetical protein BCR44DRAFT_1457516 [Catenaria anguillulae PL171]